jgi:hypothetical protein
VTVSTTSTVAFQQHSSRHVWRIDVIADGVLRGHIDRSDDTYRYFEGVCNDVIWSFADRDLARLQSHIRESLAGDRPSD